MNKKYWALLGLILSTNVWAATRAEVMAECRSYIDEDGIIQTDSPRYFRAQRRVLLAYKALYEVNAPMREVIESLYSDDELTPFDLLKSLHTELTFAAAEPLDNDVYDFDFHYNQWNYLPYREAMVEGLRRMFGRLGVPTAAEIGPVISTRILSRTIAQHERAGDTHLVGAFRVLAEAFHASAYFKIATRCQRRLARAQ